MRRNNIVKYIVWSLVCVLLIAGYLFFLTKVDTWYAVQYEQVFGSYDIAKVDSYLDDWTIITYQGRSEQYGNLRHYVIAAFEEKDFQFTNSSYGHGNDFFWMGIQRVGVYTRVQSDTYTSYSVNMELQVTSPFTFRIKSLSSDDDFFGYLFFGIQ